MIVIRKGNIEPNRAVGDIFAGDISFRRFLSDKDALWSRVTLVEFTDGATTLPHTHPFDQLLIVLSGDGVAEAEGKTHDIGPGDVLLIPEGEVHSHGARPGSNMAHFAVMGEGEPVLA
jgi:quercetin dioxygenase-like cupin family protein